MAKIQELAQMSNAIYDKTSWDAWKISDIAVGWIIFRFYVKKFQDRLRRR